MIDTTLLALRYAELALRNGEAHDALAQLDRVLGEPDALSDDVRWRARILRATSLEAVGSLEASIDEIESLLADSLRLGRLDEHLRLAIDAMRCYEEVGDLTRAVEIGEATLQHAEESDLRGTEDHARLASALIGAYYEAGDIGQARELADRTIAEIDTQGSRPARAAVYWNASLAAEAAGDVPAALTLAERAVGLYAEHDDARALGRLRTAYGWLLLRADPTNIDAALVQLEAAREQLLEVGTEIDLAYCETEIGRAELLRGDPQSALDYARSAADRLGDAPRLEQAYTRLVEGRALLRLNRRKAATAAYLQAARVMTGRRVTRKEAAVWRELADAFTELGLLADAAVAYRYASAGQPGELTSIDTRDNTPPAPAAAT